MAKTIAAANLASSKRKDNNRYELVAGKRRWQAERYAGLNVS